MCGSQFLIGFTHLSPGSWQWLHRWVIFGQVPGHSVHVPFEVFTFEVFSELFLSGKVTSGEVAVLGPPLIDVLSVLIHPCLCHSLQVLGNILKGSWIENFSLIFWHVRWHCIIKTSSKLQNWKPPCYSFYWNHVKLVMNVLRIVDE